MSDIDSSEIFSEENDFAVCFFFIPVVENNEQDWGQQQKLWSVSYCY